MTVTLTTALRYEPEHDSALPAGYDKREFQYDQNGAGGVYSTVVDVLSASETDLDVSALPSVTGLYIENLSSNFVTYGPKSGGVMIPLATLDPGQYAYMNLIGTLRWQADTANVEVLVWLFE